MIHRFIRQLRDKPNGRSHNTTASDFDNVLNECLEMLASGKDISHCATAYPQHAAELIPLLKVAQATRHAAQSITPSADAKARGMLRLSQAQPIPLTAGAKIRGFFRLDQALIDKITPARWWQLRIPQPLFRPTGSTLAAAFAFVFLTIVAAGGTAVASSDDSIPGESLYWVKNAREKCEEYIAHSAERKAHVHARHARERGKEMRELIVRGRGKDADQVVSRLHNHLNHAAKHMGITLTLHPSEMPHNPIHHQHSHKINDFKRTLAQDDKYVRKQLKPLINHVPEDERTRLWRLMHQSNLGYHIVIVAMENGSDTEAGTHRYYTWGILEHPRQQD